MAAACTSACRRPPERVPCEVGVCTLCVRLRRSLSSAAATRAGLEAFLGGLEQRCDIDLVLTSALLSRGEAPLEGFEDGGGECLVGVKGLLLHCNVRQLIAASICARASSIIAMMQQTSQTSASESVPKHKRSGPVRPGKARRSGVL